MVGMRRRVRTAREARLVQRTAGLGALLVPEEELLERAARSLANFDAGLERIRRIAHAVADGGQQPDELRHLQRQIDRSVQELDALAEACRYDTMHIWDRRVDDGQTTAAPAGVGTPGKQPGTGATVWIETEESDELARAHVRMMWPVPSPRHRLTVQTSADVRDVLTRVARARARLAADCQREGTSTRRTPASTAERELRQSHGHRQTPWRLPEENLGVTSMVMATVAQIGALATLLAPPN